MVSYKVLHLIDSGGIYGAETMLFNLVKQQKKMGLEPIIGSIGEYDCGEKPIEKECSKNGIKLKKIRMRKGLNILGALRILKYAKEEKVDILHSHGYKSNILLGIIPSIIRKIPVIATIHGSTRYGGITRMFFYEALDKIVRYNIDAVVYVSKAMQEKTFVNRSLRSRIYVINNGIEYNDISEYHSIINLDKEIEEFCKKRHVIGTFGRLSEEKGYKNLIESIDILINKYKRKDICLIIFGEGKQKKLLNDIIEKDNLKNNVLLAGYHNNVIKYTKLIDTYILSSYTEGWPMALLEIMGIGIPIIATSVGGIPELLDDGKAGVLMNDNSPEHMAMIINNALNNPDVLKKYGEYAKLIARKNYSSNKMTENYNKIYCKIIT